MSLLSLLLLWPSASTLPVTAPLPLAISQAQNERHLDRLLQDIGTLRAPEGALPGNLIAFGEDAFIIASGDRKGNQLGVIGAASFGRGRVVAFGHNGFLGNWQLSEEGGTFLVNATLWASKTKPSSKRSPRIAVIEGRDPLRERLQRRFDKVKSYGTFSDLTEILEKKQTDVIVWARGKPTEKERDLLTGYVRSGGGVLLGVCPWGNQQSMDNRGANESIRTHLAQNLFLAPMGLVFGGDTVSQKEYVIDTARTGRVHGGRALKAALAWIKSGKRVGKTPLEPAEAANQVAGLLRALPPGEREFAPRVEKALKAKSFADFVPGPGSPTQREDIVGYFGMLVATDKWNNCDPEDVEAATGHEHFPGALPPRTKRIDTKIEIKAAQITAKAWISTGYYAPAGEVVRVQASKLDDAKGWSLRIGAHKDRLWHKDKLNRWPEVTRQWKIEQVKGRPFRVASPFGGLVYLVPSKNARPTKFKLENVVEAPFFQLGDEASRKDWIRRRKAPAPWAELACDGVVLTVPSGAVRELDDPTELMKYWQRVMNCYPELRGEPQPDRPERLVEDIQISAGWMHSGYPVMTHGAEETEHSKAVDLETLKSEGNWGYFHEFGHNAQKSEWTFPGTGEVTCNLFSLYIGEQMAGIEPWNNPWLLKQHDKPKEHLAKQAPFDEWKKNPGLALMMYATMQREFGWEPFKLALAAYVDAPPEEKPKTAIQKHDRWMLRMSQATGRNLGPYFERWGVPTSEAARGEIAHLKAWMPAEY